MLIGDFVVVTDGPWKDCTGKITKLAKNGGYIVNLFKQNTRVRLDDSQMKSIYHPRGGIEYAGD